MLPIPSPRKQIHTRETTFLGFQREDGLYDIEAHLIDNKPEDFSLPNGQSWKAGVPIHNMWIRLTINDQFQIVDIVAHMNNYPLEECPQSILNIRNLIGIRLGKGWRKAIEEHMGGIKGCTHIRELLFNMATAAFQSIPGQISFGSSEKMPAYLDQCHGWDIKGPAVLKYYPKFYKP